jgi:peptidoglycan hydrolase-like protein with peptidoglycan-binding domain
MTYFVGETGPELVVIRAFTEALHERGTGAVGGQFVAKGAAGAKKAASAKGGGGNLSFDGRRGAGYGKRGGDSRVKALQEALNKLGLTDGSGKKLAVDGKLGPRTTAAIKKAQRKLGLKADGVVTPALLRQLRSTKSAKDLKAAPAKKAAPAAKKAVPVKPAFTKKAKPKPMATIHRSVGYSRRMTHVERHASHNQKSHGNRLGKPSNVGGKTGLAKATAALEGKSEEGPDRAPQETSVAATHVKDGDEITVKGVRMVVKHSWYEGRYSTPQAKRMTNMRGFEPEGGGETIWVAAHVKVKRHEKG